MTKQDDGSGWKSSTRGDQAWKEDMERVASRNAETRKQGRTERETREREREERRRAGVAKRNAATRRRTR
jgi:hypothetical protein